MPLMLLEQQCYRRGECSVQQTLGKECRAHVDSARGLDWARGLIRCLYLGICQSIL